MNVVVRDWRGADEPTAVEVTVPIAVTVPVRSVQFLPGKTGAAATLVVYGSVFDDANHNHVRDAGEAGIAGVTVYVDVNRNDVADAGETRAVTDADGAYAFITDLGMCGPYDSVLGRRKDRVVKFMSTNMPAAAVQLDTDSNVPAVTSTYPTGSTASRVRARCAGEPGICASMPSATAPNSAYGAITRLPSPYRQA